ncbi:MAG: hypothetical protein AAFO04_05320 [Cyanobacteria bacterium J06592_8]
MHTEEKFEDIIECELLEGGYEAIAKFVCECAIAVLTSTRI